MGRLLNIVNPLHRRTKRDYLARMVDNKSGGCQGRNTASIMGRRSPLRYGGYKYDGRWKVAEQLIRIYGLQKREDPGSDAERRFFFTSQQSARRRRVGFDFSEYGVANAKGEIRGNLFVYKAQDPYPFGDKHFDLVISLGCCHNLRLFELKTALAEMERVAKNKYFMVESYRNESELFNLECWALTCESFFDTAEWIWLFNHFGFTGDYEFIYFE